jgi:hypothetical protein
MKSHHPEADKPHFAGCVAMIPERATFIEFIIAANRHWGIPIRKLELFILESNPESGDKKISPPDLLFLAFETHFVFLFGWRLELMIEPLMQGRVKRIHAEKFLGTLMIEEPWVSNIAIIPRTSPL